MADINTTCNILNGLSTAFFTGLLAIFGFLQWKAVEKQNKQNLFKLRMEHYVKYKNFLIEIASLHSKNDTDEFVINKDMINKLIVQIKSSVTLSEESKYLFSQKISALQKEIFNQLSKIRQLLEATTDDNLKTNAQDKIIHETDTELESEFNKFLFNKP